MPHSGVSPASPPSVSTANSGADSPVVRMTRHSERAMASSRRASTSTASAGGASMRAVASAGRMRTWWLSRPRAGSTSALGAKALVSSRRWAIQHRIGGHDHDRRRSPWHETGDPALLGRCPGGGRRDRGDARGGPTVGDVLDAAVAAHPALRDVVAVCSVLLDGAPSVARPRSATTRWSRCCRPSPGGDGRMPTVDASEPVSESRAARRAAREERRRNPILPPIATERRLPVVLATGGVRPAARARDGRRPRPRCGRRRLASGSPRLGLARAARLVEQVRLLPGHRRCRGRSHPVTVALTPDEPYLRHVPVVVAAACSRCSCTSSCAGTAVPA